MLTMKFPETKIKPLSFKSKLGQPLNIYSTTFGGFAYPLFIFSLLTGFIGTILTVTFLIEFNEDRIILAIILTSTLLISYYIYIGNRYRYIATFSEGFVIKERFKHHVIKYQEIDKNELHNLSFFNFLRTGLREELAIDIILKNGDFISLGESFRIIRYISYPRIPSGVRVLDIKKLHIEIEEKINGTTNNKR